MEEVSALCVSIYGVQIIQCTPSTVHGRKLCEYGRGQAAGWLAITRVERRKRGERSVGIGREHRRACGLLLQ